MSEGPRLLTVGTISNGATPIQADVRSLGQTVAVRLSTDYSILCPPGYPARPGMTGVDALDLTYPRTIASGTVLLVLACEAAALVGAVAATYA
jgi:archaellum component FlaG (FlaF/FlaG flagellin family)